MRTTIYTLIAAVAVLLFTATPAHADILAKNRSESCFNATRCQLNGAAGLCNTTDVPMIGHRATIELTGNLAPSSTVFLSECFYFDDLTSPLCVPAPITACTATGCSIAPGEVKWIEQKPMFRTTLDILCRQSIGPGPQGATEADLDAECKMMVDAQMQALDAKLTTLKYVFKGVFTPNADGINLDRITTLPSTSTLAPRYEWASDNNFGVQRESKPRSFMAFTFGDPIVGQVGNTISNKLSILGFKSASAAACNRVKWDPFGRIFNYAPTSSTHLEPVAGVWVGVYGMQADGQFKLIPEDVTAGFINPRQTATMGDYSFLVGNGTYRLQVKSSKAAFAPNEVLQSPAASGQIPGSMISLDSHTLGERVTVQIGEKQEELYPKVYAARAGIPAPDIIQQGKPERADIAISGVEPQPIFKVEIQQVGLPSGNQLLKGTISKPFGRIVVTLQSSGAVVGQTYASVNGEFALSVDPTETNAQPGDAYVISVLATPLTVATGPAAWIIQPLARLWTQTVDIIAPSVHAVEVGTIPVRVNTVKGYAYDASGAIMKNATVRAVDIGTGLASHVTTTDSEGMFTIASDQLPAREYVLMYTAPGQTQAVRTTQSEFIRKNKAYIEESGQNIFATTSSTGAGQAVVTESPVAVLTQKAQEKAAIIAQSKTTKGATQELAPQDGSNAPSTNGNRAVAPMQSLNTMMLVYIVILLVLVVSAGILVVFYLKKKQEPHIYG